MIQTIQPHLGQLCLVLTALLGVTESLPFMEKVRANGILHGLYLKLRGLVIDKAKAQIAEEEKSEAKEQ